MMYRVIISEKAKKQLSKLDKFSAKIIINWIRKNLENTSNPRIQGKALTGSLNSFWRYRVGNYRIIAELDDTVVTIYVISVGHRKDIYKKLS